MKITRAQKEAKKAEKVQTNGQRLRQLRKDEMAVKKAKTPKAPEVGVRSGGQITVNEAVGCHFRAEEALEVGAMISVTITHKGQVYEIPMVVRYVKELKNKLFLTMCFLVKGQKAGHHVVLGAEKGNKATVTWE